MSKEYKVGDTIDHMTNVTGFHSTSHLFFKRLPNGDVKIQKWSKEKPWTLVTEVTVNAHSWASVVSSVSYLGEDYERYQKALDYHEER